MSNPRILAARMTERPIDYGAVPGGTPGLGLTGMDIAGAMAMGGATRPETLMVLHKWVMDKSVQGSLFYEVYLHVADLAIEKKWRIPKGKEYLRRLTKLAIAEVTDPQCCPTCKGRKEVWRKGDNRPTKCNTCNGIGRRSWADSWRASVAGIDKASWCRKWADRYRDVKDIVEKFERGGLRALRMGLE